MKQVIYILFAFACASCQNNGDSENVSSASDDVEVVEDNPRLELLPEPDKKQRLEWERRQRESLSNCFLENPDSSVNGILIRNALSIETVLGKETKLGGDQTYRNLNSDKSTYLDLTVYPGDYYNQVSVFEVGYSQQASKGDRFLDYANFKTEKGVQLGLTKAEIVEIFGNCYKAKDRTDESVTLVYKIELPQDTKNNFLKHQNMPVYFAEYEFKKNELVRFEFGFEYP